MGGFGIGTDLFKLLYKLFLGVFPLPLPPGGPGAFFDFAGGGAAHIGAPTLLLLVRDFARFVRRVYETVHSPSEWLPSG